MRRLALALPVLLASAASAQDWEVELSLGGAQGSKFIREAPFEFRDLTFEGPYRSCDSPERAFCLFAGLTDVLYALEDSYATTALAGLEVRRRVTESLALGVGVLGGVAPRKQRLFRGTSGEVTLSLPPEPDALFQESQDIRNFNGRYTGVGAMAYLHAGLRLEKGFETRTAVGYRSSSIRLFAEGGGGFFPLIPGKDAAGIKSPPGIHLGVGLRLRRRGGRVLSFSLFHVRALADTGALQEPRFSWTGLRVGWTLGR